MSNSFYNKTGAPSPNSPGSSAQIRNEFNLIYQAFEKFPPLSLGDANRFLALNSTGDAITLVNSISGFTGINATPIGALTPSTGAFTNLTATNTVSLGSSVTISGGNIDNTAIGVTTRKQGYFTSISANAGITGTLTGNVIGNITADSGTSTFTNVTINGQLDMNGGTSATIINLSSPVNAGDAATKGYVDTSIASLIDSAPGTLDTLNELAAALGDDPNFATTMTNLIGTKLSLAGGTMTGSIAMGNNKITGLGNPSASGDATNKGYVDGILGSATAAAASAASAAISEANAAASALSASNSSTSSYNSSVVSINNSTQAGVYAGQASTSASNAATSATNAANSATQAANSAASAAAIVLGVASNRPSIRPSLLLDFANSKTLDPRITFSRPTTATYYDGKTVVKAEENMLTYSQEFDNAAWTKANATVTANATTAPDGTTTADLLTAPGDAVIRQQQTMTSGLPYVLSCYMKANGVNFGILQIREGANGIKYWFDLANGVIGSKTAGAIGTHTITSVGNGWYRCSVAVTYNGSSTALQDITCNSTDGAFVNGGTIYIWGAQLEQRSTVTAYTPTTTAPITNYIPALQTAAAGVPRFDHDPVTGESKGLLIEEQRTNLLTYSEQFDNAAWTKGASNITLNTVVSPNGTLTGSKLIEDTATSAHSVFQTFTTVNGTAYTLSFYIKKAERTFALIAVGLTTPAAVSVNLTTGVATSANGSPTNISSVSVGKEWYRVSFSFVGNGSSVNLLVYASQDGVWANRSYTGDGYSGVYIWGAQLEAGSFPTSYIPTVASQVTRSADSASMTGANFTSWYRTDEGSLYTEINTKSLAAANGVQLNDGTTSNRIRLALTSASDQGTVTYQGSAQATLDGGTPVAGTTSRVTIGYKLNDFALSLDGGAVATDTSGAIPVTTQLQIGAETSTAGNLTIKRIAYYPKRLSNTELQGLTS